MTLWATSREPCAVGAPVAITGKPSVDPVRAQVVANGNDDYGRGY